MRLRALFFFFFSHCGKTWALSCPLARLHRIAGKTCVYVVVVLHVSVVYTDASPVKLTRCAHYETAVHVTLSAPFLRLPRDSVIKRDDKQLWSSPRATRSVSSCRLDRLAPNHCNSGGGASCVSCPNLAATVAGMVTFACPPKRFLFHAHASEVDRNVKCSGKWKVSIFVYNIIYRCLVYSRDSSFW